MPIILILVFVGFFFHTISDRERQQTIAELREQGIYEVDYTYFFADQEAVVVYMVCDPPSEQQAMEDMISDFLTLDRLSEFRLRVEQYVSVLESNDSRKRPIEGIHAVFLEPSKDFDVGFFPAPHHFTDYDLAREHIIAHVHMGWTDNEIAVFIPEDKGTVLLS